MKVIKSVLRNMRNTGDISDETLHYFLMNNPKLCRFYLPAKIHKRLNVPGRPVISNSSYFTVNIFSFLDFHLKPLTQNMKSYIQVSAIYVVGLYLNITYEEGLMTIRKAPNTRRDKTVSTDSLMELAEFVLKKNIFELDNSIFKQLRGTPMGIKMAPLYAIIFTKSLEEGILSNSL